MVKLSSLELNHVSFSYKKTEVLHDFSYRFERGKIYALLGHNGAGKTTLLRLILNVLKLKQGTISFEGDPLLSYAPDSGGLFDFLTVEENIKIFLLLNSSKKSNNLEFISYEIRKWRLFEKQKTQVRYLSQGQKQRLSLMISVLNNPDFLLMDEPTNGIDIISQELLSNSLTYYKSLGKCIILASHDINMIEKVSDEIIILKDGRLVYSKATDSIDNIMSIYKQYTGGPISDDGY